MTVNKDFSCVHIIEPHQQLDHSRLAGTRRSYDCHFLPRFYGSREIVDNDLIRVIAKRSMADFHIAVNMAYICGIFHSLHFLLNIQKFKHPLRCSG